MDLVPKSPKEIFPLEVWSMILNKVESPYDLANCYRTCQAWAELLKKKRTTFLMPEVFPIIYKYLMIRADNHRSASDDNSDDSESKKMMKKPTEVLKLRTISRSWKTSVDDYHQNHSKFRDMQCFLKNFEGENEEPFPLLPYQFHVFNLPHLEDFGRMEFPTNCNPFITRYVKLIDGMRLPPRVRKTFLKLLKVFGSQIWNCRLVLTSCRSQAEVYRLVHSYLSLMPNLRSLELTIYDDEISVEERDKIEVLIKTKPFPKMEFLNMFQTFQAPHFVTAGILMQCKNVQKLLYTYSSHAQEESDVVRPVTRSMKRRANVVAGHLVNLPDSIVNIKSTCLEEMAFIFISKSELLQLQKLNCPLKALFLFFDKVEIAIVFEVVSTFSVTLEHLILNYCDVESNVELQKLRLELPNLKKFKLYIIFELETIDFLADCSALEEIELQILVSNNQNTLSENEENSSAIQFNGYVNFMQNSNIWQVLPKLQLIIIETVEIKRFTRHHYEKSCNKNCL